MSYLIDQRWLLFWQKTYSDNAFLFTLSRLTLNKFTAVVSRYGITSSSILLHAIPLKIWDSLASVLMVSHDVHGKV